MIFPVCDHSHRTKLDTYGTRNGSSGFWPRLHGHRHQRANKNGGEQLADDCLRDRQRSGVRMQCADVAANGRKRAKTKIGQLRSELVHVDGRGYKLKRSWVALFYKLISRRPGHTEK